MRNAMDAQEVAVGWWPGDERYPKAAFYAYAHPAPTGFEQATLSPAAARYDTELGEYILDWDDVLTCDDPHVAALDFVRSGRPVRLHRLRLGPALAASIDGDPPPVK